LSFKIFNRYDGPTTSTEITACGRTLMNCNFAHYSGTISIIHFCGNVALNASLGSWMSIESKQQPRP